MIRKFALACVCMGFAGSTLAGSLDDPANGSEIEVAESGPTSGLDFSSKYFGLAVASTRLMTTTGGANTAGLFDNADCLPPAGPGLPVGGFPGVCTNDVQAGAVGLMFGFDDLLDLGPKTSLRGEGELSFYADSRYVTGSFPGLPGPFAFFYRTAVNDHSAAFLNLYVDHDVNDRLSVFFGGGIGLSNMTVETSDFVVEALPQTVTNFAYNVGVGASYELEPGVDVFAQYRHANFGTADVALTSIVGGVPAGNYTLAMRSNEIRFGIRVGIGGR